MNYKKKLSIIGLLLIFLSVGATYAWWNASSSVNQEIVMGKLGI